MKSKSHIFMANLLREAIIPNGRVTIDGTVYRVPREMVEAIGLYPNYYRAGAVGPDFFPDMFFGQARIHPEQSGRVLKRMQDVLKRYNRSSKDYYPAYAFYLGYLTHYATDLFGHEDVNHYALGVFPDIGGLVEKLLNGQLKEAYADISIMVRHIMVESYMDNKVPEDENLDIEVPFDFLRKCFCTAEAYEWLPKDLDGGGVTSFNVLPYLLKEYKEALYNQGGTRGIEKREEYINGWLNLWATFTKIDIESGLKDAYTACEEPFIHLIINYVLAALGKKQGTYDFIETALHVLGFINDIVNTIMTLGLNKAVSAAGDAIGEKIKEVIIEKILTEIVKALGGKEENYEDIDACMDYIKSLYDIPQILLDDDTFFELHNKKAQKLSKEDDDFKDYCLRNKIPSGKATFSQYLDFKWGNYGKDRTIEGQKYLEFKRCLKMGLLCMIGANNLNRLFYDITGDNKHIFEGVNREFGVYRICVDITVSNKSCSGTDDNVYLEIGSEGHMGKYKLDHGGVNDFENSDQRTYEIYLTSFLPFNKITKVRLRKESDDDLYLAQSFVKDMDTGILIARGGSMDFTPKKNVYDLAVTSNLDKIARDVDENGNDFVGGVYVAFKADSTVINREIAILGYNDMGNATGVSFLSSFSMPAAMAGAFITRILPSDMGVVYIPLYVRLSDISKFTISLTGDRSLQDVFIYNAVDFRLLAKIDELSPGSMELALRLYQFPSSDYSYRCRAFGVIIKTAESAFSGTNDDISMEVYMKDGTKYDAKDLDTYAYDDFEAGDIDMYSFLIGGEIDLENVREFVLHKSCNSDIGDWTVDFVSIIDLFYGTPIAYHKMSGPTVIEGDGIIKITDGYWKRIEIK
ncbi:MAG: zinc dependent phospholipase C family protein [Acholeplasmatales bacterium]|nr:zinc dependent phospholipase C family protein [Acholeplasmatales bacterium]